MVAPKTSYEYEVDVDAILDQQSSDEDEEYDDNYLRNLDYILNESSSSSYSSPKSLQNDTKMKDFDEQLQRQQSNDYEKEEKEDDSSVIDSNLDSDNPKEAGILEQKVSDSTKRSVFREFGSLSLSDRFPGLAANFKLSPKPGAALAAAAAASRPKRNYSEEMSFNDSTEEVGGGDSQGDNSSLEKCNDDLEILQGNSEACSETGEVELKQKSEDVEISEGNGENSIEVSSQVELGSEGNYDALNGDSGMADSSTEDRESISRNSDENIIINIDNVRDAQEGAQIVVDVQHEKDMHGQNGIVEANDDRETAMATLNEVVEALPEDGAGFEALPEDVNAFGEKEIKAAEEIVDVDVKIEDHKHGQTKKKTGKKSSKSNNMSPLELAEEREKIEASSALHWEEGAASQPMRLEGIKRGPPAIGHLHVESISHLSNLFSSSAFKRDHGSPECLAVHLNFISVGLSRGSVFVFSSKYSPNSDNIDSSKVVCLNPPTETSRSAVSSMCFNQQGDMLLVGYGSGSLILWEPPKATPSKIITANHTSAVVQTMFLSQDLQNARQFKAISGDCKGNAFIHTISVVPLFRVFNVVSQCLLDSNSSGKALCISPLLGEYSHVGPPSTGHGVTALTPASLGDIMGGFVGSDTGKKHLSDVSHSEEGGGLVNFVSQHLILVFRLVQNPVCVASLTRPDGIREGAIPYTSWRPSSNKKESMPRNKTANNTSSGNAEHSSLTSMNEGAATKSSHDLEELDNSPFLAIGWDKKVLVTQLIKSELKVVREWNLDCTALGVAWLEDQMLAILNSKGQLCLFTKEGLELDRRKLGSEDGGESAVIYHTHFINSFGNPEKAYHNSMTVRGSVLYLLGPNTVFRSRLLPWNERIKALQNAGDWMSALKMAMDLYDGNTLGVIGLPKILDSLREAIMPFLLQLLSAYVDEAFSYISLAFSNQHDEKEKQTEGKKKEVSIAVQIKEQFARVGGVAIEFCVHIKRTDVLFDEVFSKFLSVQHGGTFLELLEPYILKDMLGFLPPEVMQALVEHYSEKGWLQRIEQCVLHMDIASLDFNQVVKLCKEHELYSALIYLFNRGLDDFKAPLEELLLVAQDQQRPDAKAFGYKLLVYLKYCFLGLAFPPGHGHIPLERLPSLREELLQFLLQKSSARDVKNRKTSDSNNQMQSALLYLLSLDTHATLFVLKCAFSDDPFTAKDVDISGLLHETHLGKKINESVQENRGLQLAQSLVDALIEIIEMCLSGIVTLPSSEETKDKCYENNWTLKSGMQILIHFIACFVANKYATVPKSMLITILEHLGVKAEQIDINADDGSKKEILRAHENLMLALLKVVPESDWDKSFVLKLAENSKFYQVSGYIYELREQCSAALECYIKDLDNITYAFAFASNTLIKMEVEKPSLLFYFRSEVLKRMPELIQAHREAAFLLVLEHFNKENQEIISGLSGHPQILFLYLKTLINVLSHGLLNYPSLPSEHNTIFSYFGFKGLGPSKELSEYMKRISNLPALLRQNSIEVTDDIAESYLELLCQYEPKSVLSFLESFENYRVEYCLKLCQDYGITDAAAFLLERVGDVGSALTLIICDIGKKIEEMDRAVAYYFSKYSATRGKMQANDFLTMPEVSAVHNILRMAVGLCQRNTLRLDPQESEFLWFRLLDVFSEPLQDLYNCEKSYGEGNKYRNYITDGANGRKISSVSSKDISNWRVIGVGDAAYFLRMIFTHFVGEIAEGMMGHIPLPIIMGKLLSDIGSQEFGDLKPTILGMLGTCGYEQTILGTAKSLIEDDTYYNLCILKKGASHAYSPKNTTCCICGRSLAIDSFGSGICLFSCGHSAHFQCQIPDQAAHKSNHVVVCPTCMPKKNSSKGRSKLIATHNKILKGSHESVAHSSSDNSMLEKQYGLRQQPRFEILSTLKKREKSLDSGSLPSLRLAPPLVYHERKTQKISPPEVDIKIDNKLNPKSMESLQAKNKSAIQLPLTNSIFGSKKRKQ